MCNLLNFIDNINNVLKLTHFVKATYEAQFPRLSGWGCALFGHCSEPSLFASCFSDDRQIIWNCKRALQSNASFDKSCLSRDVLTQKKSINSERSFHPHLSFIRLLLCCCSPTRKFHYAFNVYFLNVSCYWAKRYISLLKTNNLFKMTKLFLRA